MLVDPLRGLSTILRYIIASPVEESMHVVIMWPWVKIQIVPPVNIPIPTKIGSKMGGAATPKWDPIGFDPQPYV